MNIYWFSKINKQSTSCVGFRYAAQGFEHETWQLGGLTVAQLSLG
jgi:hypothetical protein